ncbi:helix-turn-helix domain-containing protein [Phyllobacterium sp. A18/5-2]|uniref:helix-turn-helix domain-containing protein n=1 Tax=Phyllobacterium sp. A18/5-2 TaxID=2978392 RepID=UPI003965D2D7
MEFGDQLKQWRSHRHLSQLDLAALDAGISARHLSFLETGRARPSEGMIVRICETLELPFKILQRAVHCRRICAALSFRRARGYCWSAAVATRYVAYDSCAPCAVAGGRLRRRSQHPCCQ